jgi:16S rRNA (guanine527-N7)-methyltransferase
VQSYLYTLLQTNTTLNLVAASQASREALLVRHVEDSLSLLPFFDAAAAQQPLSLLDVGSGAGFPGLVLAIARPLWRVTLLDSLRKRVHFLEEVAASVPLPNVRCVWARAEEAAHDKLHREAYDVVTARAVAKLDTLAELSLPFLRVGGLFLAMKNADAAAEALSCSRAVSLLGGGALTTRPVATLGPDGRPFHVISCEKLQRTPPQFPRSPGMPKEKPL